MYSVPAFGFLVSQSQNQRLDALELKRLLWISNQIHVLVFVQQIAVVALGLYFKVLPFPFDSFVPLGLLRLLHDPNKLLVFVFCVCGLLGVQQIDRVVEVVEETLKVGVLRWKSVSPFLMLCGTGEYDKNSWPEKDGIGTEGWWSEIGAAEDTQKRPG